MRAYNEVIEVRTGLVGQAVEPSLGALAREYGDEGPSQFLWRGRLWQVRAVHTRWLETSDWWNSPAARGDDAAAAGDDLLGEQEVWRVEAANGRTGSRGVYELSHAWGTGQWRLRAVVD